MKSKSTSPVVQTPSEFMDFYVALRHVAEGAWITRMDWMDENIYIFLSVREILGIHLEDGNHDLIVSLGDMIATDWYCL